jgi:SAM-dependent methyltransferase
MKSLLQRRALGIPLKSFGAAMQINSGLRSILALPWVYRLFAHILGLDANRGLDISDIYIQAARAKFRTRGGAKFLSGSVEDWTRDPLTYEADLVLTNGVLHHVNDDDAKKILEFAYRALKDNGRFIFYEPCYLIWQSGISAYFMSLDRGQNIRTEQQWKELPSSIFPVVSTNIVTGVNRLGYVCRVGQCRKSAIASTSSS